MNHLLEKNLAFRFCYTKRNGKTTRKLVNLESKLKAKWSLPSYSKGLFREKLKHLLTKSTGFTVVEVIDSEHTNLNIQGSNQSPRNRTFTKGKSLMWHN